MKGTAANAIRSPLFFPHKTHRQSTDILCELPEIRLITVHNRYIIHRHLVRINLPVPQNSGAMLQRRRCCAAALYIPNQCQSTALGMPPKQSNTGEAAAVVEQAPLEQYSLPVFLPSPQTRSQALWFSSRTFSFPLRIRRQNALLVIALNQNALLSQI